MTTEIITLTPDSRAVALRKIVEIQQALATLGAVIKAGDGADAAQGLGAELSTNVLKVAEFTLADLGKTIGIETDSAREREQRYADLRRANGRVRELEGQLGNSQGADVTQASIKALVERIDGWWDLEGFGHITGVAFEKYGCKVNFSCSLFGDFPLLNSLTPISDKDRKEMWHASLRERGFILAEDGRDLVVEDCDASRKALCALIVGRLPSARVLKIDNCQRSSAGCFVLRGVEVYINKLADILELPIKPTA